MKPRTIFEADAVGDGLLSLLHRAKQDSQEVLETNDIPQVVRHFAEFRKHVRNLRDLVTELEKHVEELSYESLPTMFQNQGVKTIRIDDVGRVTINDRWSASMLNKLKGFAWLRKTGNDGLIIETVNAQTLAAFAKQCAIDGEPLPNEIFKVGSAPYVSITQE